MDPNDERDTSRDTCDTAYAMFENSDTNEKPDDD